MSEVFAIDAAIKTLFQGLSLTETRFNRSFNPAVAQDSVMSPFDAEGVGLRNKLAVPWSQGFIEVCRYDTPAYTHETTGVKVPRERKYTVALFGLTQFISEQADFILGELKSYGLGYLSVEMEPTSICVSIGEQDWESEFVETAVRIFMQVQ